MTSQAALDLCWAINSPSLVDGVDVASTTTVELDAVDDAHLAHFLSEQSPAYRVGRYFEHLLHYWLLHIRRVEVIATGLQLKDGKVTVGEIDFLYRDEAGSLVHCEASVKFFLHSPGLEPSEYPGPNARDNFERKVTKLFDQQLLASHGRVEGIDRREGFVRGIIFYPPRVEALRPPQRLATGHRRGVWTYASELESLDEVSAGIANATYALVDKPNWLAPVLAAPEVSFHELTEWVEDHFASDGHPVMISIRSNETPATELQRCFVVGNDWPAMG